MSEPSILQAEVLKQAGFAHAFSLRRLDFRPSPARAAAVAELARAAGFPPERLYQVSQVHGARVVVAEGDPSAVAREEADALVARGGSGAAIGIRVADCVPLLVGDEASGAAAAIHAGWRGVVAGVVPRALEALGARAERLVAAIGPCIGPCCFEVGADVAEQIGARFVARRAGEKAYVDLRRAVRAQLAAAGIDDARVEDVPGCTKCDAARFFSYRRDGADGGRHLGAIAARAPAGRGRPPVPTG